MPEYPNPYELASLLFAEAEKGNMDDAYGILNVLQNRTEYPRRYGEGYQGAMYKRKQFSGVGSREWKKALAQRFTPGEKEIFDNYVWLGSILAEKGLPDVTQGATHYYNPALANPKWARGMLRTYKTSGHEYYK